MEQQRGRYRSNYRSQYRKHSQAKEIEPGFKEVLVMQCIVCGIVLAFVLAVCLIDAPMTQTVRNEIKTAVSKEISAEQIKSTVQGFLQAKVTPAPLALPRMPIPVTPAPTPMPTQPPVTPLPTDAPMGVPDVRIDEDILRQIEGNEAGF